MGHVLEIRQLSVEFPSRRGVLKALDEVSFSIKAGEVVGVVGESGAGKSLTGAAIIGLLEPPGRVSGGKSGWKDSALTSCLTIKCVCFEAEKLVPSSKIPLPRLIRFTQLGNS